MYKYIYTYVHTFVCTCKNKKGRFFYIYIYIHIHIHIHIHVHIHIHIHIHICIVFHHRVLPAYPSMQQPGTQVTSRLGDDVKVCLGNRQQCFCKKLARTEGAALSAQCEAHMTYGFKVEDIAGPIWNPSNVHFHWYLPRVFATGDASCEAMFPRCVSFGPNLVWRCCQMVAIGATLEVTWTSMRVTWLQFGAPIGTSRADPSQLCGLRRANGPNSAGGEGNRRTSRTNLRGETDLTKPEHAQKPHDTLYRGTRGN